MERQQAVAKIRAFDSCLHGSDEQKEFHRSIIKNGKKFVALIDDDLIRFTPGHYVVAPLSQITHLQQKQTVSVHQIDNTLYDLCGMPLQFGTPLYDDVDQSYVSYCMLSSESPSEHHQIRTYWLLRP